MESLHDVLEFTYSKRICMLDVCHNGLRVIGLKSRIFFLFFNTNLRWKRILIKISRGFSVESRDKYLPKLFWYEFFIPMLCKFDFACDSGMLANFWSMKHRSVTLALSRTHSALPYSIGRKCFWTAFTAYLITLYWPHHSILISANCQIEIVALSIRIQIVFDFEI